MRLGEKTTRRVCECGGFRCRRVTIALGVMLPRASSRKARLIQADERVPASGSRNEREAPASPHGIQSDSVLRWSVSPFSLSLSHAAAAARQRDPPNSQQRAQNSHRKLGASTTREDEQKAGLHGWLLCIEAREIFLGCVCVWVIHSWSFYTKYILNGSVVRSDSEPRVVVVVNSIQRERNENEECQ